METRVVLSPTTPRVVANKTTAKRQTVLHKGFVRDGSPCVSAADNNRISARRRETTVGGDREFR